MSTPDTSKPRDQIKIPEALAENPACQKLLAEGFTYQGTTARYDGWNEQDRREVEALQQYCVRAGLELKILPHQTDRFSLYYFTRPDPTKKPRTAVDDENDAFRKKLLENPDGSPIW